MFTYDNDNEGFFYGEEEQYNYAYGEPDMDDVSYSFSPGGDDDDDEEEEEKADWGDIDPQHDPLAPPGPNDPSFPGSAI